MNKTKKQKQPLMVKQALAAHCSKCHRYQLVEKRHDHGKLRLSCGHKIRPREVSRIEDATDPDGPRGLTRLEHKIALRSTSAPARQSDQGAGSMSVADVRILITDSRDGCTYERVYMATPDWSVATQDLIGMVMPGCWPDYGSRQTRVGDGKADGPIRDQEGVVGRFHVEDAHP